MLLTYSAALCLVVPSCALPCCALAWFSSASILLHFAMSVKVVSQEAVLRSSASAFASVTEARQEGMVVDVG